MVVHNRKKQRSVISVAAELHRRQIRRDEFFKAAFPERPGPIKKTFENAGIKIEYVTNDEFLKEKNLEENAYLSAKKRKDPRNQNLFRNNIRKKGVPTRCIVCGNDNPNVLKAAHLWEVSSIKNADSATVNKFIAVNNLNSLTDPTNIHKNELFYKKYCLTNSGDNGIWLTVPLAEFFTFVSSMYLLKKRLNKWLVNIHV